MDNVVFHDFQEEDTKGFKFDNVKPLQRHDENFAYFLSISAANLAIMYMNDIIIYKGEVQRGTKLNKKGEEINVFSQKHVKEILQAALSNNIFGNLITLNYPTDNEYDLEYNPEEELLKGEGVLQVIDGQHRILSSVEWYKKWEKNPETVPNPDKFFYLVAIHNLSLAEAKMLFIEYASKSLSISKVRISALNEIDESNKIVQRLINESDLKGKVETVSNSVKKHSNHLTTFAILTEAVKKNFKPATKTEVKEITEYLVDYFDELINNFKDYLDNVPEVKTESLVVEPMTFHAYIALAKEMQNDPNWKKNLGKFNEEVEIEGWRGLFLDKSNPIWEGNILMGGKLIHKEATKNFLVKNVVNYIAHNKIGIEE